MVTVTGHNSFRIGTVFIPKIKYFLATYVLLNIDKKKRKRHKRKIKKMALKRYLRAVFFTFIFSRSILS
jgi:hypothetical protein